MTTNKLGITLSPSSKTNLLNECCDEINKEIIKKMSACCLCNLVGDNCDIRITPNHQALDHQVKDCHYFATLLIFSRMAEQLSHMSTLPPQINPDNFNLQNLLLTDVERQTLFQSYKVLIGRLLAKNIPAFRWLDKILPHHIPHTHSDIMGRKSHILPLKIILKNEAKYEDCVHILDETEALMHAYLPNEDGKQIYL